METPFSLKVRKLEKEHVQQANLNFTPTGTRKEAIRPRLDSSEVRHGVDKEDLEDWIANNQDEHTEEELAMIKKISTVRSQLINKKDEHSTLNKQLTKLQKVQ